MAVHRLESRDFPPHLGSEKTIRPLLVLSPSMIRFSFIPAFVLFVVLQTVAMVFLQHVDGMGCTVGTGVATALRIVHLFNGGSPPSFQDITATGSGRLTKLRSGESYISLCAS